MGAPAMTSMTYATPAYANYAAAPSTFAYAAPTYARSPLITTLPTTQTYLPGASSVITYPTLASAPVESIVAPATTQDSEPKKDEATEKKTVTKAKKGCCK